MTAPRPHLLLFDIDGTLMITKGAGSRCIRRACQQTLGDSFRWTEITPGMLDPQIFERLATQSGFDDPKQYHEQYRDSYLQSLKSELDQRPEDVTVLPGIADLLTTLTSRQEQGDVVLGLLTGNYAQAVAIKLGAAHINPNLFPIHAFAEDGLQRSDLLSVAIQRYEKHVGQPADLTRVVIIGDTPRDIQCAHSRNCIAFAVATGWYSAQALIEAGADHIVEDFSSPDPLLKLLPDH
jgi:phosphoglycolate phosphatase